MSEPPSKRMRMSVEEDDMDDEEYEEVVSELAAEWRIRTNGYVVWQQSTISMTKHQRDEETG